MISLRAIPGMVVLRPADANEMTEVYRTLLGFKHRPAAIICSRQPLPIFDRSKVAPANGAARGAYVLADAPSGKPDVILIGTGSEVSLCMSARDALTSQGVNARVVSMPSWELFEEQDAAYQDSVLPPAVTARVTVEEAAAIGWDRYAGRTADCTGDAHVRHVGTDQGGGRAFRLYGGACGRGGETGDQSEIGLIDVTLIHSRSD